MPTVSAWSIPGSDGEPILGNTHTPDREPRATLLIAHGFKGYKDYGMFPFLAEHGALAGFTTHRFNFSHSGMTNEIETFARPELFEIDTWNRQVDDLVSVVTAIRTGTLAGGDRPLVMIGHSRGGVSVLLAVGRHAGTDRDLSPAGVVTAAAPSVCCSLTEAQQDEWRLAGHIVSPSARTGQDLRIDRRWLDEQEADPAGHDLLRQVRRINCPICVIHGSEDPTVPASSVTDLCSAADDAESHLIDGANHVFDTTNPFPVNGTPSPALESLIDHIVRFADRVT